MRQNLVAEVAHFMVVRKQGWETGSKEATGSGDKRYLKVCFNSLPPPTRPHIVTPHSAMDSLMDTTDEVSVLRIHLPVN